MSRSIALLRAVNVGGRALPMTELRTICAAAGATDVATYIQSGNVVLTHRRTGAALEKALETALRDATGLDVPVLVRRADELAELVAHNPYPGTAGNRLVVWFLRDEADAARLGAVDVAPFAPEHLTVHGREVYLFLPDGQGRSPLVAALDKVRPRVLGTARNWNTVEKLLQMAAL